MSQRYKVVHLTSAHRAQDLRIYAKECRSLSHAGYDVISVGPLGPADVVAPQQADVDGGTLRIDALPVAKNRAARMTRTVWQVFRTAVAHRADLYHFHDPELIPVGFLLKAAGRRVIYDVHENLPQDILYAKEYIPRVVRRLASLLAWGAETIAGEVFDGIVTVSDGFVARFPARKTCVVRNYPVIHETSPPKLTRFVDRSPVVAWTGGLSRMRCAYQLVDALEIVQRRCACQLKIAGRAESDNVRADLARRPGWEFVDFVGLVSHDRVAQILSQARVGLAVNARRPDYIEISTNKIYEYMLYGMPLVVSEIPSWRSLIDEIGCGIVVDSQRPEPIAEAISWLMENPTEAEEMGSRGREAVLSRFAWKWEGEKLVRFYDSMLRRAA